jgi:hypothetical protein
MVTMAAIVRPAPGVAYRQYQQANAAKYGVTCATAFGLLAFVFGIAALACRRHGKWLEISGAVALPVGFLGSCSCSSSMVGVHEHRHMRPNIDMVWLNEIESQPGPEQAAVLRRLWRSHRPAQGILNQVLRLIVDQGYSQDSAAYRALFQEMVRGDAHHLGSGIGLTAEGQERFAADYCARIRRTHPNPLEMRRQLIQELRSQVAVQGVYPPNSEGLVRALWRQLRSGGMAEISIEHQAWERFAVGSGCEAWIAHEFPPLITHFYSEVSSLPDAQFIQRTREMAQGFQTLPQELTRAAAEAVWLQEIQLWVKRTINADPSQPAQNPYRGRPLPPR